MATLAVSPIELCPLHFGDLALFNRKIGNLDEVLLYSKICFHQQHSKISHAGRQCIARSRQDMANWFGWSLRKIDALLASLEKKGFISKTVGLWKGIKAFFISSVKKITYLPINLTRLNTLTQHTGSVISSIIFSRIAFGMNNTKLEHEGIKWCAIKKEVLADLVGIGIRTLDKILNSLKEKGLILKKNFIHRGKRQMHYHIPESTINTIVASMEKASGQKPKKEQIKSNFDHEINKKIACAGTNNATGYPHQNCRLEPAKSLSSIKEDQTKQKTKNITTQDNQAWYRELPHVEARVESDIHCLKDKEVKGEGTIGTKGTGNSTSEKVIYSLSARQQRYIKGVVKKIMERDGIKVSNPKELLHQLCYAVANDMKHKGLEFLHAVNRNTKIIRDGNWKTPFGFYKYSDFGLKAMQNRIASDKKNEKNKTLECQSRLSIVQTKLQEQFGEILKLNLDTNTQSDNAGITEGQGRVIATKDLTSVTKVNVNLSAESNPKVKSRLDTINGSITRYQLKLATVTDSAKEALEGLIERLCDERNVLTNNMLLGK